MFGRKKKIDSREKMAKIEKSVWELENKQLVYLEKMKAAVAKQAEYKAKSKAETDRNMQRHYASLYLNCEKEKEQIANAINEISKEILAASRMMQLVDTEVLTVELEKTESLSLDEINAMSEEITKIRTKRDAEQSLKNEAIDRALRVETPDTDADVDRILGLWEEEKTAEDALKLGAEQSEKTAPKVETPAPAPETETETIEPDETDAPDKVRVD